MQQIYDLTTSALTLKGLTGALDTLTLQGFQPDSWPSVTALIRTINQQAKEHFEALAHLPEQTSIQEEAAIGESRAVRERVDYFAGIIGRKPPAQLLDGDAPSDELRAFCVETGMSLDWAFCGDLKAMVLASHRARHNTHKTA